MEREILEALFQVFDADHPRGLNLRVLLEKASRSLEILKPVLDHFIEQELIREIRKESIIGYAITRNGIRHYFKRYMDVDPELQVEQFKDETLEALAMHMGNTMTGSEIKRFLGTTGIPKATIGAGTKWKSVYSLLRNWNRPFHCFYIVRMIQRILDPSRFLDSSENRGDTISRLNRYLEYDRLRITPEGRVIRLGAVEAPKKTFIEAVADDERMYTTEVIVPLLKRLGFVDVVYAHGREEYGRDVTFSKIDEFGIRRNYAAQIKVEPLSGEAGALIDKIVSQVDDAFLMPYTDLMTKEQRYISSMYIITSKTYTRNAVAKIIERVKRPAIRNNLFFIDGEKIKELWKASSAD